MTTEITIYQGNTELTQGEFQVSMDDAEQMYNWLREVESDGTKHYYQHDVQEFLLFVAKPVSEVERSDMLNFRDSLNAQELTPGTVARKIYAVRSFFRYCTETSEYLDRNRVKIKTPKVQQKQAHRILSEVEVMRLIEATKGNARNHALVRLLYNSGMRVSEVCGITWNDCIDRDELGVQITVIGKGNKQREVLVSRSVWEEMKTLRKDTSDFVFQSRKATIREDGTLSRELDESAINRIITNAAKQAGIEGNVSPHWLRHSHASHALQNGANINLVSETLGHDNLSTTGKYLHSRPNTSSSQFVKDF